MRGITVAAVLIGIIFGLLAWAPDAQASQYGSQKWNVDPTVNNQDVYMMTLRADVGPNRERFRFIGYPQSRDGWNAHDWKMTRKVIKGKQGYVQDVSVMVLLNDGSFRMYRWDRVTDRYRRVY